MLAALTGKVSMTDRDSWAERPWILAAIAAAGAVIFSFLTDSDYPEGLSVSRQVAASFVGVATVALVVTLDRLRWWWAVLFALTTGAVMALVGWSTASYNEQGTLFEFPYLSGLFASLVAAPFFQATRDAGSFSRHYPTLHRYAWSDAVIGAASLFFVGLVFLLSWLLASLFDAIGIEFFKTMLEDDHFPWGLAGFAFGGATGLLRESDKLLDTLLKLVMTILAVLAPVVAVALVLFLAALPVTGLASLWDSGLPETPLLLASAAWGVLLANSVIGTGEGDRHRRAFFVRSAMALTLVVLPMAVIAAISLGLRIDQHGWTPDRIWGVIVIAVAVAYGIAAWKAAWTGRNGFDEPLRGAQVHLGLGLIGIALFLALPILDFGAISARSQLERLQSGKIDAAEFDWYAMAFDFGPSGRRHLEKLAEGDDPDRAKLARKALDAEDRWSIDYNLGLAEALDERLVTRPANLEISEELRDHITTLPQCMGEKCLLVALEDGQYVLIGAPHAGSMMTRTLIDPDNLSDEPAGAIEVDDGSVDMKPSDVDFATVPVEVREETWKRIYVDGKPVGPTYR